jgi:HEAT repeat protein
LSEDEELRKAAERALADIHNRDIPGEKVVKEVAILFRINPGRSSGSGIEELYISNLSLPVDLEFLPLYWLGRAEKLSSITLLRKIFENESSANVKEELVTAVGIHDASAPVFAFLKQVVNSKEDQEVRESAVFWSGQQNSQDALNFLIATADNDPSKQIREEAVFAISQIELPEATRALINLAKNGKDQEVQEEAIFGLGQKASKQAEIALEDFAYNHEDYELQKSAVFALSQLSGDAGVPKLIQIAKTHPFPKIRKEAIFWLSQSDDPRALDTLVEIVQQR